MAQKVKCLPYKPKDLSWLSRSHVNVGKNRLHEVVLTSTHVPPSPSHTYDKLQKRKRKSRQQTLARHVGIGILTHCW